MFPNLPKAGLLAATLLLAACSGGSGGGNGTDPQDGNGSGPGGSGSGNGSDTPAQLYSVGGQLSGLGDGKTVVLGDASGPRISVGANGSYRIQIAAGAPYELAVMGQPAGQTCTFTRNNHAGTATADVGDIDVACQHDAAVKPPVVVSGTVTGIGPGHRLDLQLESGGTTQQVQVGPDGHFTFPKPVDGDYQVAVITQPDGLICTVTAGQGQGPGQVAITCTAPPVTVTPPPVLPDTPAAVAPLAPTKVTTAYGVRTLKLGWDAVAAPAGGGAVTYRVYQDADGPGRSAPTQIATGLTDTAYTVQLGSLWGWLNANYTVQACNAAGCSASSTPVALEVNKAIGYFKASNTDAGDVFGISVALSADGTTLAVGSLDETSNATGINGNQADNSVYRSGAVYVFVRTSGVWAQQAYLKASKAQTYQYFGGNLAFSADGNTLAVSASGDSSGASGIDADPTDASAAFAGAVYVFVRNGTAWSQQAYLKASNADARDGFGASLALSASGDAMAVGATSESSNATGVNGDQTNNLSSGAGAAYVFTRQGTQWSQQAYIKAGTNSKYGVFGISIALSEDGSTLAVGEMGNPSNATGINGNQADTSLLYSGAVWVYTRAGNSWSQQAYVKASHSGAEGANFGTAVQLSADGNTMAVGAPEEGSKATGIDGDQTDGSQPGSGAVYVFTRSGLLWSQQAYIKASNTKEDYLLGGAGGLALSADGNTLAVGAIGEASAAPGINGVQSDSSLINSGAVYVFSRNAGIWSQKAYVKPIAPRADAFFGRSVALSRDGKTLAVGSMWESSKAQGIGGDPTDTSAKNAGAVFLY